MADKRKRTNLSIADKVKFLDRLKNGAKKEDIMTEFKISQRTLKRIAKSEKEIRQDAISMQSTKKRKRAGRYKDVDTVLLSFNNAKIDRDREIDRDSLNLVGKCSFRLQVVSAYMSFFSGT